MFPKSFQTNMYLHMIDLLECLSHMSLTFVPYATQHRITQTCYNNAHPMLPANSEILYVIVSST